VFCPVGVSGDACISFGETRLSVLISIISSLYSSLGGLVDGCRDRSAAIKWITLLAVIGGGSGSGRNVGISGSGASFPRTTRWRHSEDEESDTLS
jgi:hypothetical protein